MPSPKSKSPWADWTNYVAPAIVVVVIMALTGVIYNSMAGDIQKNYDRTCDLQDTKVDNTTLKLLIQQQNIQIQQQTVLLREMVKNQKELNRRVETTTTIKKP